MFECLCLPNKVESQGSVHFQLENIEYFNLGTLLPSFLHSFKEYFLRIYLVPGTIVFPGDDISWLKDSLCLHGGYVIVERDDEWTGRYTVY